MSGLALIGLIGFGALWLLCGVAGAAMGREGMRRMFPDLPPPAWPLVMLTAVFGPFNLLAVKLYFGEELRKEEKPVDYAPRCKAPGQVRCDARYRYWTTGLLAESCSWPECDCGD